MPNSPPLAPALYKRFYVDKVYECVDLYRKVAETFEVKRALYAGSFVHIAPSFVIPEVVYVDSDKRCPKFFADPAVLAYAKSRKEYGTDTKIRFHAGSYTQEFDEPKDSFDLLISQYAGFVAKACKQYLRIGGVLLANNSHGDAGLAKLDPDFEFVGVVNHRNDCYTIKTTDLEAYFVPKRQVEITAAYLEQLGRGLGYQKTASFYLFKRAS